ncbi:hypothetical protein DE146DRAFT_757152 [Phaeosphaeria sp. MPI-PUGE-AT-0046c]|nr:hypothetical protein DE146DRAFT_757152 [Phaeosphaeria sp. MPI-PUGE-AT-0046c]
MANIFFEQQLYTLEDLQDYALQQFPNEYAALATCPTWVIEHRTIRNGAKKLERVPMLLVGRPFYHHGNQTAWAYTTGTNIEYYYAGRDEEFVTTVPDLFNNKIYYNDPLTYIAGSQDTYGMSKSRRTGKALAELVINFMFLFMGHNATMQNPGHTDLLPDFEYACKTFAPNRQARMDKQRRELVAYHRNDAEQAWERQHGPQMASSSSLDSSSTSSYIKSELGDDGTALALDSIPLYDSATSSVSGSTSHIRSHLMSSPVALANRSHSALSSDPFRFRLPLSGSSRSSSSATVITCYCYIDMVSSHATAAGGAKLASKDKMRLTGSDDVSAHRVFASARTSNTRPSRATTDQPLFGIGIKDESDSGEEQDQPHDEDSSEDEGGEEQDQPDDEDISEDEDGEEQDQSQDEDSFEDETEDTQSVGKPVGQISQDGDHPDTNSHGVEKDIHSERDVSASSSPRTLGATKSPSESHRPVQSRVPSFIDQAKAFEDQLRLELAEDKAHLEEENLALKTQLEQHKQKTKDAQIRLKTEREGRSAVARNLKEALDRAKEQKDSTKYWKQESEKHEQSSKEWQTKYTSLKRKLKELTEDVNEPAKKVAKR